MNLDQTISDLSALSIDDRLRIVQRLWDSIPADTEIAVTPEQRAELERRIAAHEANPDSAISSEELERRLQGRH
jgi:putative addiction module component (TIGR02574 family)